MIVPFDENFRGTSGNTELFLEVLPNPNQQSRSITIELCSEDETISGSVTILQEAAPIPVVPEGLWMIGSDQVNRLYLGDTLFTEFYLEGVRYVLDMNMSPSGYHQAST